MVLYRFNFLRLLAWSLLIPFFCFVSGVYFIDETATASDGEFPLTVSWSPFENCEPSVELGEIYAKVQYMLARDHRPANFTVHRKRKSRLAGVCVVTPPTIVRFFHPVLPTSRPLSLPCVTLLRSRSRFRSRFFIEVSEIN